MSELTNIHARAVKDLTTPTELPVDHDALEQVKLVAGNFPTEYAGNEALTVKQIKDLATADLESKKANKTDVEVALSNLSTTANKFYPTLSEANSHLATMSVNAVVTIGEEANKGLWYKATAGATTLTKSAYDPLTQANNYTNNKAIATKTEAVAIAKNYTDLVFDAVPSVIAPYVAQAEAAATVATIGAGVFETPEAGVDPTTGVEDGEYFNVRSPSSDSYIDEYQNIDGVATPSGKTYPSGAYVQNIVKYTARPFVEGKTYSLNERVQLTNGDIVKSTINGNSNNPNANMTGWVFDNAASQIKYGHTNQDTFNKKYRRLSDYINPSDTDHTASILQAFSENNYLYLGSVDDVYELTAPITLRSGMSIKSDGAKFVGKLGIEGSAPYTPRGIINANSISDFNLEGWFQTYIDHNEFSTLGDATNKPTITGFLGDGNSDCNFGFHKGVGSVNYYYEPNYKEYGIADLRNSTDCFMISQVDGLYGQETAPSTPSTIGIFGTGNTRCTLIGRAKNCYWSGILWEGIDCKVLNPIVRNTRGSNLNLAGINTNAYNVDLKTTKQGNVSIGEGTDTCYSCSVFGGTIGDAQYANVALHTSSQNCKVFADIYGWGQIGGATDDAKVGVRVRGTNNHVEVFAEKVRDGLTSFGWAVNCHSTTLANPETNGNTLIVKSIGANVSVKAPNTIIDIDIKDAPTLSALDMGFRCAGSEIRRVRAENCLRPIAYAPNTGDSADYANVKLGSTSAVNCVGDSVMPVMDARYLPRARDVIKSTTASLALNDVLYALEAYTADSNLTGNKLAAAIKLITTDAFGTSYGVDLVSSTISSGSLLNAKTLIRAGSVEVEATSSTSASKLILQAANGTKWKLEPTGSAGAANWVAV